MSTFGYLTGQLTLTANTKDVADTVRELFRQADPPEVGDCDE